MFALREEAGSGFSTSADLSWSGAEPGSRGEHGEACVPWCSVYAKGLISGVVFVKLSFVRCRIPKRRGPSSWRWRRRREVLCKCRRAASSPRGPTGPLFQGGLAVFE